MVVTTGVGVGDGVGDGVGVGVDVGVGLGVGVGVEVAVGDTVGVLVSVGTGVAVAVGSAVETGIWVAGVVGTGVPEVARSHPQRAQTLKMISILENNFFFCMVGLLFLKDSSDKEKTDEKSRLSDMHVSAAGGT